MQKLIVVATKHEAKPLIDILNLEFANKKESFKTYQNQNIKLIISGIGKINSAIATTFLLQQTDAKCEIFNIGIAAGLNKQSLYEVGEVVDKEIGKKFVLGDGIKLICSDFACTDMKNSLIADMEASGFLMAAFRFLSKENIKIIKLISDVFEPKMFDKKYIYDLFFKHKDYFLGQFNESSCTL